MFFWVAVAGSLVIASTAQAISIDTFATDQSTIIFTPATTGSNQASGSGIVGGERDVTITLTSGVGVTGIASGGNYAYGHVAGSEGTISMVWDGIDGSSALNSTGLGGADFTDGGVSNGIALSVLFDDFPAPMTLTVYTDAGNVSQASVVLPGNIPPDPQMQFEVLFTDFSAIAGIGADFANVGAFVLDIDGSATAGLDVEIDSISTLLVPIPEPTPAVLLAGGLVGFSWIRRRRFRT
ncbi:MAG: PEP-CTERM sorting domain-containing protein [Myxococcota bacterium]